MDEHRQLLFVNQFLPSNEQKLIDRLRDAANRRNTRPPEVTAALQDVPMDSIADIVVGPRYVGVLFTDGQVGRYPYVATSRPLAPSASPAKTSTEPSTVSASGSGGPGPGGGGGGAGGGGAPPGGASASFLERTAKFRRYERGVAMMSVGGRGGRGGRDHRSVIIDRARPLMPASSVPEDLIAQAQVVLQGKSREMIIRELQRTNLNVNEAVNNLLSRDDDDDDGSEGADMCIPEELLNLLDSSHGGVLESDLYPPDSFEYLMSNRDRRNKNDKDKDKQKSTKPVIEPNSTMESLTRYEIPTGSISEPWQGSENKEAVRGPTPRFTHIACTQSELLAISSDSKLYGWKWSHSAGDINPHVMFEKLKLADGEMLTHISACSLRVAVMTSERRLATWMDTVACGERLSEALFVPPQQLDNEFVLADLVVSNQLAVARYPDNTFYWCGLYPVNDRRRIFEKARTRQRKHVTFDTTQIVEGSEVRTKSGPIYSIGCIAANLSGPKPMVGILMENAWSLSEVCRFRLLDPSFYDSDRYDPAEGVEQEEESREAVVAQQAIASGNRKRPATDELFGAEPKLREEPWPISDVVFIHEEVQNDTAIVKIVDGGHCAVEYQEAAPSPTDSFATNASKQLARKGDKDKPKQKMRLIRKDELTVVSHKMRYARSPNSRRVEPYKFVLSGSHLTTDRVLSVVADSLGIRALVVRRGIASIVRVSVRGKTLTSHILPIYAPSLHFMGENPTLLNYGDDSILLIRDGRGGIIPLVRDAAAGFREPSYLQLSASSVVAMTVRNVKDKDRPSWAPKANREAVILSLQGTDPRTLERRLPSLMYTVMSCDAKAVKKLLDALEKEEDLGLSKQEIVDSRADGNRNVLHVAVMNAFAIKNGLEADVENPMNVLTTSESRASADSVRAALDKKWNEMLKSNRSSSASAASASAAAVTDSTQAVTESTQGPTSASASDVVEVPQSQIEVEIKMEIDDSAAPPLLVNPSPVENPRQRQENSIAIVKMLVTHPSCIPFMTNLLGERDILGQTPFMAAVNNRAYSAARYIFNAVKELFVFGGNGTYNESMADHLVPFLFPIGSPPDDSPLFILCYNDPCSFTWTGDEHINQDIFECRTCGLTGSLCCCTECAFTCHRNHDCKLKRTSPTAYCDCWEKSCCNALVNGNQHARENLLIELIGKSNMYTKLNGRGEHILLYLARKFARQSSEQWNYTRRPRRVPAASGGRDCNVPEHDLDPPKFARTALLFCVREWSVVRSLAMIGVRQLDHSMPIAEEIFHLTAQNGSSHLDKFMLILLTKCSDEYNGMVMENLMRVLTEEHNKARKNGENLEEVNFVISRFVRSVGRLFILAVIISSVAASTAVSGVVPSKESSSLDRPSIRGITFSSMFGHLRKEPSKDSKHKNMGMFIVRCKAFFEHFAIFALHEMAQLADASLAPVRTGIVRPCVSLAALLGSTSDCIENLEKYINSEPDVAQQLMGVKSEGSGAEKKEERKEKKRRKRSSRRDTDRGEAASERTEGTGAAGGEGAGGNERVAGRAPPPAAAESSDSESDSDSDGEGFSSRRLASQSSALAANEESNRNAAQDGDDSHVLHRIGLNLDRAFASSSDDDDDDEELESESEGEQRENDEDEEEEEGEDDGQEREEEEGGEEEGRREDGRARREGEGARDGHRMMEDGEESEEQRRERVMTRAERRRERRREEEAARRDEEDEEDEEESSNNRPPNNQAYFDSTDEEERPERERARSATSPEYSSAEEGDEHNRGRREGGRRQRDGENAADGVQRRQPRPQLGGRINPRAEDDPTDADEARLIDPAADHVFMEMDEPREQRETEAQAAERRRVIGEDREGREGGERDGSDRTRREGEDAAERERRNAGREENDRDGEAIGMRDDAMAEVVPVARQREEESSEDEPDWVYRDEGPLSEAARAAREAANEALRNLPPDPNQGPRMTSGRGYVRRVAGWHLGRRGVLTARRGGPVVMNPPRRAESVWDEEDGTVGEDRLNNRRNATADASRPSTDNSANSQRTATRGRSFAMRTPRYPPWVSRGIGESEGRSAARARVAAERGGEEESGSNEEKKNEVTEVKEDETPTTLKAALQLATAFSFAVRVIDDLLPIVAAGSTHAAERISQRRSPNATSLPLREIDRLNDIEEAVRRRAIDHVITRLDDSWRWLAVVLDHAEAQIKYVNAVTSTEESRKKESKEKKKNSQKKKNAQEADSSTTPSSATPSSTPSAAQAKRDTISCLLGVLRAHSGEAGDDLPMVDMQALRAPALVVDAYLGFVESKEEAEKLFELSKETVSFFDTVAGGARPIDEEKVEILGVRKFYQRSNSVSFPGVSFTDAHDTLQVPCGLALPIVERPQLLTSTVEKEVIFGPPPSTQERTKEEHDKVIRAHGVSHPHNLSLTAAPIPSHQLFVEGGEKKEDTGHAVHPIQPVVIPAVASAPSKMNEMANEEKKEENDKCEKSEKRTRSPKSKRGRKRNNKGEMKQSSKSVPSDEVIVIDDDDSKEVEEVSDIPPSAVVPVDEGPPDGFERVTYEELLETFKSFREHPIRKLMGRWRFALQLIAKELHADLTNTLGGDLSGSRLLRELAGFDMKQHELRVNMEKYRTSATKDLSLEVPREDASLVRETCYQLNTAFTRRIMAKGTEREGTSAVNTKKDQPLPVMATHKIKVKFIDEPGEGSGVSRSYFTALAEALMSLKSLPFTDYGYRKGNDDYLYGGPMPTAGPSGSASGGSNSGRRIALIRGRDTFFATVMSSSAAGGRRRGAQSVERIPLNYLHTSYTPNDMNVAESLNVSPDFLADLKEEEYAGRENPERLPVDLTDRLFIIIRSLYPAAAARLTGMFLDLPLSQFIVVLSDPAVLRAYLDDAVDMMMTNAAPTDIAMLKGEEEKKDTVTPALSPHQIDDFPLFFRPSKNAHYSPVPGSMSPARMNAFRNVGRVIGLCLMQCEMFPLRLSRHVFKYILGRPLNWHDFAFYDPALFESFRKMIVDGCTGREGPNYFENLYMSFCMDMPPEAYGLRDNVVLGLHKGGVHRSVTKDNIIEYVYRCVEQRLLGNRNGKCLQAMIQGVHDVIPPAMLDNLTAEDLRLVLCGTETVSLTLMQSYTQWTDESHAATETIEKFKQWFWQVADRLSQVEKSDLIFFWTGVPTLPSTEEGFQPMPTIVIRPTDDGFLPTANTCISRLYLPLYTTKKILTAKLQLAIKAKNFGFV